jgi:ADP-heptose:LPS heptosyltransferase
MCAAVIARLNLLVSNDTGAAHMAAAVGTPSVVIFGPGRPEQWGRWIISATALSTPGF